MNTSLEHLANMTKEQQMAVFSPFYGNNPDVISEQMKRRQLMADVFRQRFNIDPNLAISEYRAPGRIEIVGNHNDHQLDPVLCAAIDDDVAMYAVPTKTGKIRIIDAKYSKPGKPIEYEIDIKKGPASSEESLKRKDKLEKLFSLADGVVAGFLKKGIVGSMDMVFHSNVGIGSGVSSSASLSCAIATALNHMYNFNSIPNETLVDICQNAEHNYMGKKCGKMDQTASLWGGFLYVEFPDAQSIKPTVITKDMFDLEKLGYSFVVVDTGGSHDNLDDAYSEIPADMKFVASQFGADVLSQAREKGMTIGSLKKLLDEGKINTRQHNRALHNMHESAEVKSTFGFMKGSPFQNVKLYRLLTAMNHSGVSSIDLLANFYNPNFKWNDSENQRLASGYLNGWSTLAGDMCALRLMGGGFAGTTLALIPNDHVDSYVKNSSRKFGPDCAKVYNFRPGAGRVEY